MGRISAAEQSQKRHADTKLAQSRLSVLELAKELGNVAEACRPAGARPDQLLRMEAAVPDERVRRADGPAADPQVASADDAGAGGRAD